MSRAADSHHRTLALVTCALLGCAREPSPGGRSAPQLAATPPTVNAPREPAATADPAPGPIDAGAPPSPDAEPVPAPEPAPAPAPEPRDDDFVDVSAVVPDAVLDMRYATTNNFTHKQLYPVSRCLLRRAVAARLAKVAERLRTHHVRLLLWDCYRPASIQRALWDLVPDPRYVARPSFAADGTPTGGSRHSRGAAVDVSLASSDGTPVTMPTDHDDFSPAAASARAHRAAFLGAWARLLAKAMTAEGFVPIASEWWHFDAPDSARYGFSDAPLTACPPTSAPCPGAAAP